MATPAVLSRNTQVEALTVGDRIVLGLRHIGMKRAELSEITGIKASTMSRYLNDKTPIPTGRLVLIASTLGCTPNDLLGFGPTGVELSREELPVAA